MEDSMLKRFAAVAAILIGLAGCEQGYQDDRGYHRGRPPANDDGWGRKDQFVMPFAAFAIAGAAYFVGRRRRKGGR
jgi:hypothetical protein